MTETATNRRACITCYGRGEVPVYGRVGDGILFHKECPSCKGAGQCPTNDNPTSPASSPEATQQRARPYEIGLCERLRDIEYCREYMIASADGGPEAIKMALDDILNAQQAAEQAHGGEAAPLTDMQRMWDLVRQQRMELFESDLITQDEYAALAVDHPAVARLESYDELRSQAQKYKANLATARAELFEANKQLAETRGIAGELYAALDELRVRYKSLFNTHERPTYKYPEDSLRDLGSGLQNTDAALARAKAAGISPSLEGAKP